LKRYPSILLLFVVLLSFASVSFAQSIPAPLTNLPEADLLIYISPQRTLNDLLPKVLPANEVAEMQSGFAEMKKAVGVDPATIEYLVIAVRFNRPTGDLSFVAPDIMAVVGGDFSSESLISLAQLTLQDKLLSEKHGSKNIFSMPIEPLALEAQKNPILKPYVTVAAAALSPNSLAIGNYDYIKAAVDASEGTGARIKTETIQSLMRDPNVLLAATGAPWTSFARSFGLLGTVLSPREGRFDSNFGNFYLAAVISGANYRMRGAMNADNPDTAKIITNLLTSLMKTEDFMSGFKSGVSQISDKTKQSDQLDKASLAILESFKLTARDSEVIVEMDLPLQMLTDLIREQAKPKVEPAATSAPATKKPANRRPTTRKRRN
jgi:hypothetical protein